MAYEVLARKWRPQQFQDVVGQEHVIQTVSRAIQTGRVAHAYLFVGPRGTGKTTTARLLAKALNCMERGEDPNPCDRCASCREIVAGNSLDVIEIDGASNNGVEQVRELRENARYAPTRGPFKVYIIDEVHMLSPGAFNALLKILEEPPPHVKFLLATTDVHKVPVTILSRCQRFDLRRIGLKDLIGRLREIAEAEQWTVSEAALLGIARGAEGGLRDAESALDQIVSFRGETIEEADVLDVFGLVSWTTLDGLAGAVLRGDAGEALRMVCELDAGGRDLQRLLQELLGHMRNILVFRHAPAVASSFDLTEAQLEGLKAHAKLADGEKLLRVVDILTEAANQARFALSLRTVVEVALLKAARAATVVSLDELIARIQASLADGDAPVPSAVENPSPARMAEPPPLLPEPPPSQEVRTPPEDDLKRLKRRWPAVLSELAETAQLASPYLNECEVLAMEDDYVVLGFDPEFVDHLQHLRKPHAEQAIAHALAREMGRPVGVRFRVEERPQVEAPAVSPPPPTGGKRGRNRLEDDPAVRQTIEMFNAEIMDIRE